MAHVFQSSLGSFLAAERSVSAMGEFLHRRLNALADDAVPSNSLKGA